MASARPPAYDARVALTVQTAAVVDRRLPLPGGRHLAVRELGDLDGYPVLYFHGVPGVRQAIVGRAADYRAAGVRLVTFDRPGYGDSSPAPASSVDAWAADVATAVAVLGIRRFAVIGESGGGPYALACARRPPPGLASVVVASGLAPIDSNGDLEGMKPINQVALRAFRHPHLAAPVLGSIGAAFARWPDFVLDHVLCRDSPEADEVLLREPRIRASAKAMLVATLAGGISGVIDDVDRLAAPWGFQPREIERPVHFWHGEDDNTAPLRHLLRIARAIPGSTVVTCPGEGHMVMERHLAEILAFVLGSGRPAR